MDSVNSNEQKLFTEGMYAIYIAFMGYAFIAFSKFKSVPMATSVKRIQIAATIFTINFFVTWFALLQNTRQLVAFTYPMAFDLVFFSTMISAPGVLFYTVLQYQFFQHKLFIPLA